MNSPSDIRKRIEEHREAQIKLWLSLKGFQGNYGKSGATFVAHELGISKEYVSSIVQGRRHLGINTALEMRRALPTGNARTKEFNYRSLTQGVLELLKLSPEEALSVATVEDQSETNDEIPSIIPPGVDEQGRLRVMIILSDGKPFLVTLPKGHVIDSSPCLTQGESANTGSITLVFAKEGSE